MNINEYIASKQNAIKRIPSDIRERWNNRVVKYSWHFMGVDGANQYLANYGNGISALKAISLAICAESEGYPEVALGFWTRAFEIETGVTPPTPRQAKMRKPLAEVVSDAATAPEWKAKIFVPELPSHLQPESIVTMQPVDAPFEISHYINSPAYWGQPKRDGSRRVIVGTSEKVYYQSRSTNLKGQPNHEIHQALLNVACKIGTFVINGELYYRSVTGSEHRTAPQAIAANIAAGADVPGVAIYAIFKALWYAGCDLTTATETERIKAGEEIGKCLPEFFEVLPTARSQSEKLALAAQQSASNREGEIWVLSSCNYVGGKDSHTQAMVRTKYALELDLVITDLSSTKSTGRPFGAIKVAQEVDGKLVSMGSVGTGFSQADMAEIAQRHAATPGSVKITVRSQGLTETGKLWHGRFIGLCED